MVRSGESERGQLESERVAYEQLAEGRAIVAMTFEHMEKALGLPGAVRVVALSVDVMRGVVEFRFDGRGLPPCAEGAEPMRFESLREAWEYQRRQGQKGRGEGKGSVGDPSPIDSNDRHLSVVG